MAKNVQPANSTDRPRDAATLIIIDTKKSPPRILMGRRNPGQVFLPNKFVFPGGRLDRLDRYVKPAGDLSSSDLTKLMVDMKGKASKERARSLALAAIRETFEETGLLVGIESSTASPSTTHPSWQRISGAGYTPSLTGLSFVARAITPPGRPRRYDTRFFCVDASHIANRRFPADSELLDQDWFAIAEIRMLDLPHITRAVIEDLDEWIQSGSIATSRDIPVPYYYFASGAFERELIRSSPNAG